MPITPGIVQQEPTIQQSDSKRRTVLHAPNFEVEEEKDYVGNMSTISKTRGATTSQYSSSAHNSSNKRGREEMSGSMSLYNSLM